MNNHLKSRILLILVLFSMTNLSQALVLYTQDTWEKAYKAIICSEYHGTFWSIHNPTKYKKHSDSNGIFQLSDEGGMDCDYNVQFFEKVFSIEC